MDPIEVSVREVVKEAIWAQIQHPTRAVVNGESSFVAQRLRSNGYTGVAARYWSWACGHTDPDEFGDEIYELQRRLDAIDRGIDMPVWGTSGT